MELGGGGGDSGEVVVKLSSVFSRTTKLQGRRGGTARRVEWGVGEGWRGGGGGDGGILGK